MAGRVYFAIVLHDHQPVGNFDHVFEHACSVAYRPFLDVYAPFAGRVPITLHMSGPLLEWIEAHRPEDLARIAELVKSGVTEMLGGGMYEPIFTNVPQRDLAGQIEMMRDYLASHLGAKARGAWVTERVWEAPLAGALAEAGVEYVALDDSHFLAAGLEPEALGGYYLTEHAGRTLKVFPASERLRYLIPFGSVEDVIAHLAAQRRADRDVLVTYADDGEKFGLWPGTHEHVYKDGWLARFFEALARENEWLVPVRLGEAADMLAPEGTVYLPEASYREMTEWALPAPRASAVLRAGKALAGNEDFETLRPHVRGGVWRNFRVKYAEAGRLYARMREVSARVAGMNNRSKSRPEARRALYRAQCNCAWWHGVFGGLYLPHLRRAVWSELVRADALAGGFPRPGAHAGTAAIEVADLDCDGADEVRLASGELVAYLAPERGGHLYELDLRAGPLNLLDTLTRRYEAYHDEIHARARAASDDADGREETASIHEMQREVTGELAAALVYDPYVRESLIDHVLPTAPAPEDLAAGRAVGDEAFLAAPFEVRTGRDRGTVWAALSREADALGTRLALEKEIRLARTAARIETRWRWTNQGEQAVSFAFAAEMNLSPDFAEPTGESAASGVLRCNAERMCLTSHDGTRLALTSKGFDELLAWSVYTVSQSESAFERTRQALNLWPVATLSLAPGATTELALTLEVARD